MPVLARVYLIPLREQSALKLRQFRAIQADYERHMQQQEGGD